MFTAKYVATAMSVACIVNWLCNFLVGLVFPFLNDSLGPWSFAPFCGILLAVFLFTWLYLPETHGSSVEELQEMVANEYSLSGKVDKSDANNDARRVEFVVAMDNLLGDVADREISNKNSDGSGTSGHHVGLSVSQSVSGKSYLTPTSQNINLFNSYQQGDNSNPVVQSIEVLKVGD